MNTQETKVLMVGYNGANNTGAEALLLSDIEDVRRVLGPAARITVPSLAPENLRRYVKEGPTLRIVRVPIIYFRALWKLVKEHDVIMLVEGSTYMDTWGSVLLWAFLWSTFCAARMGKRCLAYAVDAGSLSRLNRWMVRRVASRTHLIITRNRAAAERLAAYGVSAPIQATADNAFTYETRPEDEGWAEREWPLTGGGMVGLAVVDYSLFPVVMRPAGRKKDCYKWPYYFSRSADLRKTSRELAEGFARTADRIAEKYSAPVALICMEEVDERLAVAVRSRMAHPQMARVFSARVHNASQMTVLLRELRLLVTCRYHAAVLSLRAHVPQIAVGHDLRLRTLYQDLGLRERFFMDPRSPGLFDWLNDRIDDLMENPEQVAEALRAGHEQHLARAARNRRLLARELCRTLAEERISRALAALAAVGGLS
jgi:polysaccharide pyruvyl transferase WcaK-like protein